HAARPRAQLQRAAGLDRSRGDGRHECGRDDQLWLDLRPIRPAWAPGLLLLLPGRLTPVPALRLERALTAPLGRDLRAELHLDRAADDHAHRAHLRPLLGRRALRLDLLLAPGGLGARRGAGGLDLRVDWRLRDRVRIGRDHGLRRRRPGPRHSRGARRLAPDAEPRPRRLLTSSWRSEEHTSELQSLAY